MNNATKYTNRDGRIAVEAAITGNHLQLSVTDNGIGMSRQVIENLFRNDVNISSERGTEGEKGTGLGLILCREFIRKHDGNIWVESEIGKGSSFYFKIPCG